MTSQPTPSKTLHIALWVVQILVALLFISTGIMKLSMPISKLAAMWPWAGEHPTLVWVTAIFDLLGGLGLVLPGLTRIRPGLTVWAALGCAVLLACAIVFHLSRGEGANTPFNFVMLGLVLFVWWGRSRKAPIGAR